MYPITFKQANMKFGDGQPQYRTLPANKTEDGVVTSYWKLSLIERVYALFTGKVWLQQLTFNQPLQPIILSMSTPKSF